MHGSLNSLTSLIQTEDWKDADMRIFLGDVCIGCSRPNECIELLNTLDCIKIIGNNDVYVCDHVPKVDLEEFSEEKLGQLQYMTKLLSQANKDIVMTWQKDLSLEIGGKKLYFTHYAWENFDNDENVMDSPLEKSFKTRKEMFANQDAQYVFFGHEHRENNFTDGRQHFYCVGTLGLKCPGYYLTIDVDDKHIEIKEKYIFFDINEEIDLMDMAGYPYEKNKIKRI